MEICDISKTYDGRNLFNNFSLSINTGLVLIEGESGTGKSTLLNIIRGRIKPDKGFINKEDNELDYSYCGQKSTLLEFYSLRKNIELLLNESINEKSFDVAKKINFDLWDKKIDEMSGGERQKAEFIFALQKNTYLLFFDEPFSSFDVENKKTGLEIISSLSSNHLIFFISHDEEREKLPYSFKLTFENGITIANKSSIINSETNTKHLKRKYKKTWQIIPLSLVHKKSFFLIITNVLFFIFAFFLLLGISILPSSNYNSRLQIALNNDPFSDYKIKLISSNISYDFFNKYDNIPEYYEMSLSNGKSVILVSSLGASSTELYYYSNSDKVFTEGEIINFEKQNSSFYIKEASEDELSKLPHTYEFQLIKDNLGENKNILICSKVFFDNVISSTSKNIKFTNPTISYIPPSGLSVIDTKLVVTEQLTENISLSSPNKFTVPDIEANTTIKGSYASLKTTDSSNTLEIGINVYKSFLLQLSGRYIKNVFYSPIVSKESVIDIRNYGDFTPVDLYVLNNIDPNFYTYISISAVAFISLVITILMTRKDNSKFASNLSNVMSEISSTNFNLKLVTWIFLGYLFTLAINLIFYWTWMIPMSNYSYMVSTFIKPEGYYYYSKEPLCSYYDYLEKPIEWITTSPWITLVCIALILIPLLCYSFKRNKHT